MWLMHKSKSIGFMSLFMNFFYELKILFCNYGFFV